MVVLGQSKAPFGLFWVDLTQLQSFWVSLSLIWNIFGSFWVSYDVILACVGLLWLVLGQFSSPFGSFLYVWVVLTGFVSFYLILGQFRPHFGSFWLI